MIVEGAERLSPSLSLSPCWQLKCVQGAQFKSTARLLLITLHFFAIAFNNNNNKKK